jgi:hypothetical protein
MKPIEIAKALYLKHVKDKVFEVELANYLSTDNGAVVNTPSYFAMGKAVDYDGKHAWYIDTAVGRLSELIRLLPFPLPYIAFHREKVRNGKLHIYETQRFLRHVTANSA